MEIEKKSKISSNKITSNKIIKEVKKTIDSFRMLKAGDKVLVSISGGPDSTFLTYVLYYLRESLNLTLIGFHLDHMTRDGESGRDALFVEDLCRTLGIKLIKKRICVKKWCDDNKLSFQEGARKLRIKMLLEISEKYNIDKIAVGHNADDNIETFLMRLIRGAGVKGLAGIKPVAAKFIRPLINTFREDVVKFLEENKIPYCIDRTNLENIYFRNKIRNILIPFIRENFFKAFKTNVLRCIEILREENNFLSNFSRHEFNKIAYTEESSDNGKFYLVKISTEGLNKLPNAIRRRVILHAVEKVKGDVEDVSYRNIEDIMYICSPGGEKKVIHISESIKVVKEYKYIYIVNKNNIKMVPERLKWLISDEDKKVKDSELSRVEKDIEIGKRQRFREFGIELFSEVLNISKEELNFYNTSKMEAFLDYDKIKFPVRIRSWKKGDKFYPLGMQKEKKLHDFFIDCKIHKHLRYLIPIFIDREKIIWVARHRIDDRVKVTSSTGRVLHLRIFED